MNLNTNYLRIPAVRRAICSLAVIGAASGAFFGGNPKPVQAATITNGKSNNVVTLALAYYNSLTATQQANTLFANTATTVAHWSNLPATPSGTAGTNTLRNGVAFSTLTTAQRAAWTNLVKAAIGDQGWNRFQNIRAADDYLSTLNSGYSGSYEYVAFDGTPSTSAAWMLQIGGHHNAHNYYYTGTTLQTTTPYHDGSEPASFTTAAGVAYAPLAGQHDSMYALSQSLTSTQVTAAKLASTYTDIYLGPGKDARTYFPTSARGILVSSLSSAQQTLVLNAIKAWVNDAPPAQAAAYLTLYQNELATTYVGISRAATGYTAAPTLLVSGDYIRIDGPHVRCELASQAGVVLPQTTIHYHTVWRDRVTDYNAAYGF